MVQLMAPPGVSHYFFSFSVVDADGVVRSCHCATAEDQELARQLQLEDRLMQHLKTVDGTLPVVLNAAARQGRTAKSANDRMQNTEILRANTQCKTSALSWSLQNFLSL